MLLSERNIQLDVKHNNTNVCNEASHSSKDIKFPEKQFSNEPYTQSCQAQWFEVYP